MFYICLQRIESRYETITLRLLHQDNRVTALLLQTNVLQQRDVYIQKKFQAFILT